LPLWKADLPLLLQIHAKFKAVLSRNGNASAGERSVSAFAVPVRWSRVWSGPFSLASGRTPSVDCSWMWSPAAQLVYRIPTG